MDRVWGGKIDNKNLYLFFFYLNKVRIKYLSIRSTINKYQGLNIHTKPNDRVINIEELWSYHDI